MDVDMDILGHEFMEDIIDWADLVLDMIRDQAKPCPIGSAQRFGWLALILQGWQVQHLIAGHGVGYDDRPPATSANRAAARFLKIDSIACIAILTTEYDRHQRLSHPYESLRSCEIPLREFQHQS